jgi:hypothetical protein
MFNSGAYATVRLSFHAIRPFWDRIEYRTRAAKLLSQPICLQICPRLAAPALAFINGIADTGAAEKSPHSFKQASCAFLAIRTVQPRPCAAKIAVCPRHSDLLRHGLIFKLQLDQVAGHAHLGEARPSKTGHREHHGIFLEDASAL